MKRSKAEILREYGPFPGVDSVGGVTYDNEHVWFACGDKLNAFDPASGKAVRSIDVAAHAGTAFDGRHLYQIAEERIQKIDPKTGRVVATIPAPGGGGDSGLAWAEGTLWVGQYRDRKIHQIDPETGAILRTIESNRFVTGVTWSDGELWHGTWEGDESDVRRVDPQTGEVLESLEMPPGTAVSGLEADGGDRFFCGGGRQRGGQGGPPTQAKLALRSEAARQGHLLRLQHVRSGLVTGVTDERMSPHLRNQRMRRDGHVDHVRTAFRAGGRPLFVVGRRAHANSRAHANKRMLIGINMR